MLTDVDADRITVKRTQPSGLTAADRIEVARMIDLLLSPQPNLTDILTLVTDDNVTVSLSSLHTARWSRDALVPGQWIDGRDVVASFGGSGRFTQLLIDGTPCGVPSDQDRRELLLGCLYDHVTDTLDATHPLYRDIERLLATA